MTLRAQGDALVGDDRPGDCLRAMLGGRSARTESLLAHCLSPGIGQPKALRDFAAGPPIIRSTRPTCIRRMCGPLGRRPTVTAILAVRYQPQHVSHVGYNGDFMQWTTPRGF